MAKTTTLAGRYGHPHPLLTDHRRAIVLGALLIALTIGMLIGVGKHPTDLAPVTTLPVIGSIDGAVNDWVQTIRMQVLTWIAEIFNWLGRGVVTIPLRAVLVLYLLWRRRFGAAVAFGLAWLFSEVGVEIMKAYFHRGRPPGANVNTYGSFSFPSGHATAGAAVTVAIVLAFLRHGPQRRKWVLLAMAFAFVMGFSRVYLGAHWLSDVETGVLFGTSVTVLAFAGVDEVRHAALRRRQPAADP